MQLSTPSNLADCKGFIKLAITSAFSIALLGFNIDVQAKRFGRPSIRPSFAHAAKPAVPKPPSVKPRFNHASGVPKTKPLAKPVPALKPRGGPRMAAPITVKPRTVVKPRYKIGQPNVIRGHFGRKAKPIQKPQIIKRVKTQPSLGKKMDMTSAFNRQRRQVFKPKPKPKSMPMRDQFHTKAIVGFRPKGVPKHWKVKPSKRSLGWKFTDPKNKHNSVRMMPGKKNSLLPAQRRPYVVNKLNGQSFNKKGKTIVGKKPAKSSKAHIPLAEFRWPWQSS